MSLNSKDWFEFILDLNLLDNYFKASPSNEDAFGCSLIIQFLYHANMTEQVYGNQMPAIAANTGNGGKAAEIVPTNAPAELKAKKIRVLRVLAIKTACILKWNLIKFEKEIPVAVMSDLLHNFLRLAMNGEQKLHSQLEIERLDSQAVFALQLLHRWCVRVIIFSKYPKRAIGKSATISAPGIVNPLQHMKDANENILRVLATSVQESVEFLEKLLKQLNHDICIPATECFANLSADTGSYDIFWQHALSLNLSILRCLISFDLGIYYFQQENYAKAFAHFQHLASEEELDSLNIYLVDLNGYIFACQTMLDSDVTLINEVDQENKAILRKLVSLEKNLEQNGPEVVEILLQDNFRSELSMSYRLSLEDAVKSQQTLRDQISSCNATKLAIESNLFSVSKFSDPNLLAYAFNENLERLPSKQRVALCSYLQLNHKKIGGENWAEALWSHSPYVSLKSATLAKALFASHSFVSFNFEKRFLTSSIYCPLNYGKFVLQRCDPQGIKYCLGKYSSIFESCDKANREEIYLNYDEVQMETEAATIGFREFERRTDAELLSPELRHFWPRWKTQAVKLLSNKRELADRLLDEHLSDMLKSEHRRDLDFFVICVAKIVELNSVKKFDFALTLLVALFDSNAFKNSRMLYDIGVYINVSKYLSQIDFATKNRQQPSVDMIFKDCKDFFSFYKNYSDIPQEIVRTIAAFVLSIGEFEFLCSLHLGSIGKNNFLTLVKHVSKLCAELDKPDKSNTRKVARSVWDFFIEVFNDKTASKRTNHDPSQADFLSQSSAMFSDEQAAVRESLRRFCLLLSHPQVSNIFISAMSTIHSIADSSVNAEISSEYRHMWPSSLASSSSLNIGYIQDLLHAVYTRHLTVVEPFDAACIRTVADLCLSQANYADAIKLSLQVFVCVTKYFFKFENLKRKDEVCEELSEKCVRAMMNSSLRLNKHTHAALLSQLSSENNDYQTIFKSLQERTSPTADEMDEVYTCLWDISLVEFLAYLNASRGFVDKRNACLRLCASTNINSANPNEVFDKTVEIKKTNLFLKLLKYYLLI